jgi:predicted RNase H-like HicB family nuclease
MKRLHDHTVVIRPEDNGTFVAYVPSISGCHAWGRTPEEAQAELTNVFAMIIEGAEKSSEKSENPILALSDDRNLASPNESEKVIDTACPRCKRECIFQWKDFKNGTRHIEKRCPNHGYIRYVPRIEPYLGLASKAKENHNQKKLF